jgi:alpha-beta hydrolase superfamily lysophospholipase
MGRSGDSGRERPLILLGHSTGGLTLSLWAARHPGIASALILNSPWLEFQATELGRRAIAPLVGLHAKLHPLTPLPPVDPGIYTRAVSAPRRRMGLQPRVAARPGLSHHSGIPRRCVPRPSHRGSRFGHRRSGARIALGQELPPTKVVCRRSHRRRRTQRRRRGSPLLSLADTVTVSRLPNAFHDIFLSPEPVRRAAFARIGRWVPTALQPSDAEVWEARIAGL